MRSLTTSVNRRAAESTQLRPLGAAMIVVKVASCRFGRGVSIVRRWVVFCYQSFQLLSYYQNVTRILKQTVSYKKLDNKRLIQLIGSQMLSDSEVAVQWKKKQIQVGEVYYLQIQEGFLSLNGKTMRFKYFVKGERPPGGYTLIFGFHGGGGCTTQVNNQQFNNHLNLYNQFLPLGTIWFVPRSCEEASDMWWKPYLPEFFSVIIKGFVLKDIVNPNKVFMTGYSAGGDGIYHLGPMLADWLAGAAMMAGHPNGVELYNVRNIAFSIQVGGQDEPYNRNGQGRKYIATMNDLQQKYGGFSSQYCHIFEDCSHWMNKKDARMFNQFLKQTRNPYPSVITFKQHPRIRKEYFYYLQVVPQNHKELLIVQKRGNIFVIESQLMPVTIYFNRFVVDFNQDIQIWHNGVLTATKRPLKNKDIIIKTIETRLDPDYIFEDCVVSVPTKNRVAVQTTLKQLQLIVGQAQPASHQNLNPKPQQQRRQLNQNRQCCNLI